MADPNEISLGYSTDGLNYPGAVEDARGEKIIQMIDRVGLKGIGLVCYYVRLAPVGVSIRAPSSIMVTEQVNLRPKGMARHGKASRHLGWSDRRLEVQRVALRAYR
jgi:hypothetical protein